MPSLNALRALEAALRTGSITAAAKELSVTPGAVSHQIKVLEEDLSVRLLQKEGRLVAPTAAASNGILHLRRAFEQLSVAVEAFRRAAEPNAITVLTSASFGSRWLQPRIDRFWSLNPEVDLRFLTHWAYRELADEPVDVQIRFGTGNYNSHYVKRLTSERYAPVLSPALLRGPQPLSRPEDLARSVLLQVEADSYGPDYPTWEDWFLLAGVEGVERAPNGPRLRSEEVVLRYARYGRGVALAGHSLSAPDIEKGLLVKPFEQSLETPLGFHLLCSEDSLRRPLVAKFVDWLSSEAESAEL